MGYALVLLQQLSALHVVITMTGGSEFRASRGGELNRSSCVAHRLGPMQHSLLVVPRNPSAVGFGTTTSSAVAKGSHVDLTSSFQSIPLGRWFAHRCWSSS
ncbi:hypothetical protein BS47DRAFT_1392674 [Hydnum rufescens UP504]|uniref:Secreted protein n=1 Tax=Hydnum rufescens UP504 TaxID=1448309 RepID=A0A9P6DWX8_9AGAM|nr:hypothetical protein BS47DRAFT_1392674 [Hydnum rufescens UP504]